MKQKMTCNNKHPTVVWTYNGNKKDKPACPICHKEV